MLESTEAQESTPNTASGQVPIQEPEQDGEGANESPAAAVDMSAPDQDDAVDASAVPGGDLEVTEATKEQAVKVGEKVSGVLTRVGAEQCYIDFGGAIEGVIPVAELRDPGTGEMAFDTGDPLEAYVTVHDDSGIILSRAQPEATVSDAPADRLYAAYKAGTPVNGRVVAVNKWGLAVELDGIRAFCPVSQIDVSFVKDTAAYRDQELEFKITRFKDQGRTVVVSRRALMLNVRSLEADEVRAGIHKGARLQGTVTRIESYGAFVDIGAGVEGLIHVSELRHERVEHPQDVVEQGAELTVAVIRVKSLGDRRGERISLSLKALEEDPWDKIKGQFPTGSVVDGKVESLEDYGAMVELADNVKGMVHVSEISERRIAHPREALSVGDSVRVAVLELDSRRKRLRLSLRRAEQMEDAANLREFKKRDSDAKSNEPENALTDALKRARLV